MLINTRYADDVLFYAKSFEELISMTESLMISLQHIGLILNTQKTKILRCNPSMDESTLNFVEIEDGFVKVLSDDESHRYLGRLLSISASSRWNIECRNRIRAAWAAFHKHKSVLLEHQLSIKLRLKYFDAYVGPAL